MRVRMWRTRGADRRLFERGDEARRQETSGLRPEKPLWRDLDEHVRTLEAMARVLRQDVSRRNASTASAALGNLMRQSQQAYDEVGQLLQEAAHHTPNKRMVDV